MFNRSSWLPEPDNTDEFRPKVISNLTPSKSSVTIGTRIETPTKLIEKGPKVPGVSTFNVEKDAYTPKPKSGAWGLLLGLYHLSSLKKDSVSKKELIEYATPLSNESYKYTGHKKNASTPSYYTAWSSIETLIKHGLVKHPAGDTSLYSLTESGESLASVLHLADAESIKRYPKPINSPDLNSPYSHLKVSDTLLSPILPSVFDPFSDHVQTNKFKFDEVILGKNEIVLLVDKSEKCNNSSSSDTFYNQFVNFAKSCNLQARIEHVSLSVGDLAYAIVPVGEELSSASIICDFLIERKVFSDLQSSFMSGHLQEQENRILATGVKRPILLVEAFNAEGKKSYSSLPDDTLRKHILNLPVWMFEPHNSISVYMTYNIEETFAQYLHIWTYLQNKFTNIPLSIFERQVCRSRKDLSKKRGYESFLVNFGDISNYKRSSDMGALTIPSQDVVFLIQFSKMSETAAVSILNTVGPVKEILNIIESHGIDYTIRMISDVVSGKRCIGMSLASKFVHSLI